MRTTRVLVAVALGVWGWTARAQSTADRTRSTEPDTTRVVIDTGAVRVMGDGPATVVLLSGMLGGTTGFRLLESRLLPHGYRVVTIDPYRLSLKAADVSFATMAHRVDRVLDQLGVSRAQVVGHAQGAGVALRVAANDSARVTALYFLDAGAQADTHSRILSASLRLVPLLIRLPFGRTVVRDRILHGIREAAGEQAWLDRATQDAYTEPVLNNIDAVVALATRLGRAVEPEPLSNVVARITVPVAVVLGDFPHESHADDDELAALVPLGSLVHSYHLPGVGHFIQEEAPDAVARLIIGGA